MRSLRHLLILLALFLIAGPFGSSAFASETTEIQPAQEVEESAAPTPVGDEEEEEDGEAETLFA